MLTKKQETAYLQLVVALAHPPQWCQTVFHLRLNQPYQLQQQHKVSEIKKLRKPWNSRRWLSMQVPVKEHLQSHNLNKMQQYW